MRRNLQKSLQEVSWINEVVSGLTPLSQELRQKLVEKTVENFRDHVNKGFLEHRKSATIAGDFAVTEWTGQGSILVDVMGREFIDALGGFGLYSLGIAHPQVVAAVKAQLERSPQYSQEMLDPLRAQLAHVLALLTPGDIQYGFFANSGTEAVEGALKLAKLHTGKSGFISMINGFHGKTNGSLSVMGKSVYREPLLPLLPNVRFAEFGNAASLERELAHAQAVGEGIAAVIAEPVQGEAGAVVPPDDFWPQVRKLCDQYGVLLIVDEVQTGFGRIGEIFGSDCWGVEPDILCLGKALGGGVVASSAFMATPEVWKCMEPNPFMHTTTTGGNPIACAAALAGIEVMLREDTPRQSKEKGLYLMTILEGFQEKYPGVLKQLRGKGLLIGLVFENGEIGYKAAAGLFKRRVLTSGTLNNAQAIRIEPALNIPMPLLDEMMNRLEDTLKEIAK
ncbi:MAG TPA: aminotransferase class III-fold pyridoxal phosphate-dependent enzyme [Fibrobacteraceae bacterium]|nr:aminotransferase class III-fold pyridoxal phosphate-dependent enzyme [Fibrobacteraceae bacterium]